MSPTFMSVAAAIVGLIGVAARIFFWYNGKASQRAKYEEEKAQRLSNRPRTSGDIVERLRQWRKKQPDGK
jgi:hypothetical protein